MIGWRLNTSATHDLTGLLHDRFMALQLKCKTRHPPGDEIYRDDKVSVFEVDGRKNKVGARKRWSDLQSMHRLTLTYSTLGSADLLPKFVFTCENVSRPQNVVLRRRTVLVLRHDDCRSYRRQVCRLLFQGETESDQ